MINIQKVWARCGRGPVEVHHALKRSRGGQLLDPYTDYHLIALCHQHHRYAEVTGDDSGLLIDGYVITDSQTGLPVYTGSDLYLTATFAVGLPLVPRELRGTDPGQGSREELPAQCD